MTVRDYVGRIYVVTSRRIEVPISAFLSWSRLGPVENYNILKLKLKAQSTQRWRCIFSVLCDVSLAAEDHYRPKVMLVTRESVMVTFQGTTSYWHQTEQHAVEWDMQAACVCDWVSRSSVSAGCSVNRFLNFTFLAGDKTPFVCRFT